MTWIEWNNIIFRQKEGTPKETFERIKKVIKFRLTSLKHIKLDSVNTFLYGLYSFLAFDESQMLF